MISTKFARVLVKGTVVMDYNALVWVLEPASIVVAWEKVKNA